MLQKDQNYSQITEYYLNLYPGIRDFSAISFTRYCKFKGMTWLTEEEVTRIMHYFVSYCGHSYGMRMMQGCIRN